MNTEITIKNDLKIAIKKGNKDVRDVLRMLVSDIKNAEIEQRKKSTDEEIILIIKKNVKRRKDSIDQYLKGGRKDLADKENNELAILQKYMPKQMTEDETRNIIKEIIENFGDANASDFGKIIGLAMRETKGMADGNLVSKLVKELLNK
ncbi:GatB/YqeY domain-containing protein [Patescibacteria group bacterium]|nr:GatB/YqeY domain-containing protein [Patescibacteria group bacterium]